MRLATSTPAALILTASSCVSAPSAFATGSKVRRLVPVGRSNVFNTAASASAWLLPLAINAETSVVSGVMTMAPGGPFRMLLYAKPVEISVPPEITIGAELSSCSFRVKLPSEPVVVLGSPSSHLLLPLRSWKTVAPAT